MINSLPSSDDTQQHIAEHRLKEKKRLKIIGVFLLITLISLVFDIATGPAMLSPQQVLYALLGIGDVEASTDIIVKQMRLPIALMALVVGCALGVGGAEIQTLLNNPMASPYTLGLAAAAGLGASLVIAFDSFGLPMLYAVPLGAFSMTLVASMILAFFASFERFTSTMLILVGIALLFLFQSALSLIQYISAPEVSVQILFWLFGSLNKSTWGTLTITSAVTFCCIALLLKDSWKLTALRLGDERAISMGVNLRWLRFKTLWLVALMTATAISFVGVIGFIGLVAPHVARLLVGEDQRFFLPAAMLIGATFLSIASVLSKVIIPGALFPIGIVTSFIGVPFFFWIILSKR